MRPHPVILATPLLFLATLLFPFHTLHSNIHVQAYTPNATFASTSVFIDGQGLYVQGGYTRGTTVIQQTFVLDLSKPWNTSSPIYRQLPSGPPVAKVASALSADQKSWFMLSNGTGYVYNFQLTTWTAIFTSSSFSQVAGLSGVTDSNTGLMYIPNGYVSPTNAVSMLRVNLPNNNYDVVTMYPSTSLVDYSVAWSIPLKSILLFGGQGNGAVSNTLYAYDPAAIWTQLNTNGTNPPGRSAACFEPAYNGTKMVLFGGLSDQGSTVLRDIYFLDVASMSWSRGPDVSLADARSATACAVAGDFFVVWGGYNLVSAANTDTTLVFNMKTNEWTSTFGLQPTTSTTPIITATSSTSTPTSTPTSSGSPPTSGGSPPVWLIILGIIIALIILIVAIVIAIRYRGRLRRANKGDGDDADHVIKDGTYDSSKDPNEYVKKEKHRYSDLRGPEAENNPFGFLQFSERRGPSTAGLGAKDDRSALPTNGARRYSHLRGPSTAGTKAHRDVPSESPRNPTEGSDQFGNSDNGPRRASRLRGPAATRMDAHEEEQDDWASLYMGIDEDSNYIPPPLPPRTSGSRRARPQRPRNPEYPPPPTSADKDLPTPPKKVKDRVRRAPATYERESVFGYVDGTPTRGAPQEFAWETK